MPASDSPKSNFIDRALTFLAPGKALKRAKARQQLVRLSTARNLYDAAALSRRTSGWRSVVGTDANSEIKSANVRLRDVARDMCRNNAYAARGKMVIANDVIGEGIIPQTKAATEGRIKQIEDLIAIHFETTDIDADGMMNLYGLQQLVMQTVVESGECLLRRRVRRVADGYSLPFQIQVLEPDYLDHMVDGLLANGNYAIQGVEFDLRGKRVAYYLFDRHPGAMSSGMWAQTRGTRVSADFVKHIYRVDRPGQVRGVTWFAPVVVRMRDFADYTDAQLLRQKIAACFAAFITSDDDPDITGSEDPNNVSPSGIDVEQLEPGMLQRLRQGESVTFGTPPGTQDFGSYSSVTLHEVSTGLGTTYEAMTGDYTGVNYSSGQLGRLQYQRNITSWQWNMLVPQMMHPIAAWTVEAAQVATGSSEPFTFGWTPQPKEMIDQQTWNAASKDAIRSGLSWPSEELRKRGYDPEEVFKGLEKDFARFDELKLVLDSDPRRVTTRGVAQKDADPNAPDLPAK
jgi:lambda family phage portal protein